MSQDGTSARWSPPQADLRPVEARRPPGAIARWTGWAYLVAFIADALLSFVAFSDSSWDAFSEGFSSVMLLLASPVVLVMVIRRKLLPAHAFLIPVGLYGCYFWLSIGMGVALLAELGPEKVPQDLGRETLEGMYPWFRTTVQALITLQLVLGLGCLWSALRRARSA